MASISKDTTPMWDIMSPEDDNAVMEKFSAESNKVINRWSLGDATFTEKDAAVAFLVQLGAVQMTIQSGCQQTASQTQVPIVFGDGEDSKIGKEHRKADPGDTKEAILREGNPIATTSVQDAEKKNEVPISLDQDTTCMKNRKAHVNDGDDEDNNYSVWMTENDDDDYENHTPDPAPVVEESSTTRAREEHPCPDCHTVLNSLWELDLHKLSSCKRVYNCDKCSRSFASRPLAIKHLRKIHNMSPTEAVEKLKDLKSTERQKRRREWRKRRHVDKSVLRRSKRLLLKLQPLSDEWVKILETKSVDVSVITSNLSPMKSIYEAVNEENELSESVPIQDDVKKKSLNTVSELESNPGCTSELVQENSQGYSATQVHVTEANNDVSTSPRCDGQRSDLYMEGIEERTNKLGELVDNSIKETLAKETEEVNSVYDQKRAKSIKTSTSCKFCDLHFKTVLSRDKHMSKAHPGDVQAYKCSTCNKSFRDKTPFRRHLEIHMDINEREKYQCKICQKVLLKAYYQIHMKSHAEKTKKYVCDTCGKGYSTNRDLKRHINSKHKKEVVYTCDICGMNFYDTSRIKRHLDTHSEHKTWMCDKCGYATFFKNRLVKHQRIVHTTSSKVLCEICGSAYKNENSLKKHLRTYHTNDYNYSCELCNMKFKSSTHVFCHKRKIHSYNPKNKPVGYGSGPSKPSTMVLDRSAVGDDDDHHEISDAVSQLSEASDSQIIGEALLAMMN